MAVAALLCAATTGDAARAFEEGRALVEANHPEKASATREGMLKGAVRLEEAIALGLPNAYRAWMLIGYAYSQIGLSGSDREAETHLQRSRSAFRSALALRPGDVEALRGLVNVQRDHASTVDALRALVAAAPNDDAALLSLGRLLLEGDPAKPGERSASREAEVREGIGHLRRSVDLAPGAIATERRSDVAAILRAHGKRDEARAVERGKR